MSMTVTFCICWCENRPLLPTSGSETEDFGADEIIGEQITETFFGRGEDDAPVT